MRLLCAMTFAHPCANRRAALLLFRAANARQPIHLSIRVG
jgi:hypothetical protein